MRKTKRKSRSDRYVTVPGTREQQIELGDSNKIHVEMLKNRVSIRRFIKHYLFNIELNVPFPQLYICGIQIIWEWDDHQMPLLERHIDKIWHIGRVRD